MSRVIALFVADMHLSWNPPVARSAEIDWLEAQARPLRQLCRLQEEHSCSVIVAGDIFDKYNPSPALINWAIQNLHLPMVYSIPGQHDLALHNLDDLRKSAYCTLMEAKILEDLQWGLNVGVAAFSDGDFDISPFPWGERVEPWSWAGRNSYPIHIAVAHSYIWTKGNQYTGASDSSHLSGYAGQLKGYDVAVFGDNHNGFTAKAGDCTVYNCGCLIRRKRDEREYKPAVGLLHDDGTVERHFLDVSEDKWLEDDEELPLGEMNEQGLSEFIDGLGGLDTERVGFNDMVRRYVSGGEVSDGVGRVMLEALEGE